MEIEALVSEEVEPPGPLTAAFSVAEPALNPAWTDARAVTDPPSPLTRKGRNDLAESPGRLFRRRFFPEATPGDWNNWNWQFRNRIGTADVLDRVLRLTEDEKSAISRHAGLLPVAVTPYYASLLDADNPQQPLRRTVIPTNDEFLRTAGEADDPLEEERDSPVPGIVHRYPDRVLFLVTGLCSTYCRYCTRSRMVGTAKYGFSHDQWGEGLTYIRSHAEVRDVLLSGGDPLTLADENLAWLLAELHRIPHVEMIRIGTKAPVVMPQRITPALVSVLKKFHPLWMSLHVTHPEELTPEMGRACARLANAGIPLGSQTVLLSGINDDPVTMKTMFQGLLHLRVKPYYLYQCDPIPGSSHFRTPVAKGLEIIERLRGHTTGYAVPTYVIDAPGGGGKVPLLPRYCLGRQGDDLLLKNYLGQVYRYPDHPVSGWDIH
ncbi:MAG: KamA family radical SAM protein [Syntrophales bacterium]|nr:KamA family radical SAM protein [Syntrophales bacterium]MDD4339116.1 KamA family radical SAM protein [Syntrophales bacterium]HOG08275.1 KamA family radical SAM protein [Syntrophales bacterium]HOS77522.1 KamA family radical SAM protein [Syntrophales bacterium]HPB70810.1 KamA family radical SAM protein [Syntrophales bacterium]